MHLRLPLIQVMAVFAVFAANNLCYAEYKDMGNGTVYDDERSLLWQKSDDGVTRIFADATTYCNDMELGDRGDWQLPSIETLSSLVDTTYVPTISPVFSLRAAEYFSSSTEMKIKTDYTGVGIGVLFVEMLEFSNGNITEAPASEVDGQVADAYTRCVITGYAPSPKSLHSIVYLLLNSATK